MATKILIINTVPTEQNGITGVIFNYLKAIDADGFVFDLLSLNEPDQRYTDIVQSKGGQVFVIPRLCGMLSYWRNLRKLIQANQYDAVHIHGNSHTVVLELSAAKAAGCVVRMVHSHNTMCSHVVVSNIMTPFFNGLYTHALACGKAAGRWMFGERYFTVINNGVDTDLFSFCQAQRDGIREASNWKQCKVIGHVGGFFETKNQKFIVDVFRELYRQDNSYRLVLIGDGPLRNAVEAQMREYALQDVITLTGNINNVYDYLNAIDLIMMPSLFEGLPLTLVEQQANGLRCVVSDAITREADKTGNITFYPLSMSAAEWAERISQTPIDCDEARVRCSREAIVRIKECGYSIQGEAEKLRDYYLQATQNKQ